MGDKITRPDHYCEGREYEPKDVIRDWGLNFNLGSAVKYISRAGRKGDKLEDLRKAKQFLEFEIEADEKANKSELSKKLFESHVNAVLNGTMYVTDFIEPYQKEIINRIVERINNEELDCFDISGNLYTGYQDIRDAIGRQALRHVGKEQKSDIGMTCKEAAEIGDAIAKGLEDGIKEAEETDIEIERKTSWYTNGILGQWYYYQNIPDGYKARVIDKIAQEVLDSQIIPPDEVRAAVIDRIVERIDNDELDCFDIPSNLCCGYQEINTALIIQVLRKVEDDTFISKTYTHLVVKGIITFDSIPDEYKSGVIDRIVEMIDNDELKRKDIPTDLYTECSRIRAAFANREYCKAADAVRKYAEDTEDTVSINFEFEVDPDIDTDTVNVHVHIKNKED